MGVGAGIAAYKIAYVVRGLRERNCRVTVLPTKNSLNFVGEQTWQELSESPVGRSVFHEGHEEGHVNLARDADLIVVAPATADLLAQLRGGFAPDLLTATFLASTCPKLLVPAMHTQMWMNPATSANVETLKSWGIEVMEPAEGPLSSGDVGRGRLPEPEQILERIDSLLSETDHTQKDLTLQGKRVVVTAGGTRESIDPVRYLGNNSSGRQGTEIALAAAKSGAEVTLIAANMEVQVPSHPRLRTVRALSAMEMMGALEREVPGTDALFMVAAVADYRAANTSDEKLKKENWGSSPTIQLEENPDLLRTVIDSSWRPPLVVGFAAETGSPERVLDLGKKKALRKGADLIAINQVGAGRGFGEVETRIIVVDKEGRAVATLTGPKPHVAAELVELAFSFSLSLGT